MANMSFSGINWLPPQPAMGLEMSNTRFSEMNFGQRQSGRRVTIGHGSSETSALEHQLEESNMFKVVIDGDDGGVDMHQVHERIEAAVRVRALCKHTVPHDPSDMGAPMPNRVTVNQENGVFSVSDHDVTEYYSLPPWKYFAEEVQKLRLTSGNTECIAACSHRLGIIQERSRMFFLLNTEIEEKHNLRKAGGVFGNVTKVDNSVSLSKCTDAQELLDFIVEWATRRPDNSITLRNGTTCTIRELLRSHNVTNPRLLTVEGLGWQPRDAGHQYEGSEEPNPLGAELRYVFLNVKGSLSSRLLKKKFEAAENVIRCPQAAEYMIPVFATYPAEMNAIANTVFLNLGDLGRLTRAHWVLALRLNAQPPEAAPVECKTFQDQIDNFFLPLFKATLSPKDKKQSSLVWLLSSVGAVQVDSIPDGQERDFDEASELPQNQPYMSKQSELYYYYYIYSNLTVLNSLRRRKGMNTFQFRVNAAVTGMNALIGGYILGDVITNSTQLMNYPVLQYLCGLHGVGLTFSPLLDHMRGVVPYKNHPLPNFLHRCLRVSISTEAPLLAHHNPKPLDEEYATAQKIFRLSPLDVSELAYNSVIISSFPRETKMEWIGEEYELGVAGNDFDISQVTNIRLAFREEQWKLERSLLRDMYLSRVSERGAGLNRWHYLSNVQQVEYNTVLDSRIRFPRTVLNGPHKEAKSVAPALMIARALDMRAKYQWKPPNPWEARPHTRDLEQDFQRKTGSFNEDEWTFAASDAVFVSYRTEAVHEWPRTLPTLEDFHRDLKELQSICASALVKEYAHKRLENLDHKFRLHLALNHANEAGTTEDRKSSNRDIYQAVKVDTHIHMAAGMTAKQVLQFMLTKLQGSTDDIAMKKGDDILTLGQLFKNAGITPNLTIDQLNIQADHTLFERFDNFNNKYNPMENGDLRSLMLKTDNFMNGRYFAEIIHDVFDQYSRDRYTYAENRVSVYGINIKEWDKLSSWFETHGMSSKHNKWIIQVPRVYKVFRAQNVIGSFGQYLQNIFQPLWEASLHPAEHPTLHNFLKHVSGFDSVDNEATIDLPFTTVSPWAWTAVENPPYNYYLYYLYANIRTLNEFRASRGFSTFAMRPHCGESGSDEHLYGAFLCANSICHGINLRNDPPMQYLYYLTQIGLHVSPLSNNALFLHFLNNPFPDFFRRGLNVSLSTDDPMMFHQTQEPLIEEYSIAARVWGLSPNDLCEIARNSVLQCGFDYNFKREAIGDRWYMSSSLGNDPLRTHLSDIRVAFRFETYHTEMQQLEACCNRTVCRFMLTADEEREINEQNLDVGPEKILLSTHDQTMEVMLRDIDTKREQMRVLKNRVDVLRRQHHSLVDNITEVGVRRQEMQEQMRKDIAQEKLHYERQGGAAGAAGAKTLDQSGQGASTVQRLMRWRPTPPTVGDHSTEANLGLRKGRPLPRVTRTI